MRRREAGLMLIEILVVVAIIGLIMGTVGVMAFRHYRDAQVKQTKMTIHNTQAALTTFRLNHAELCPSSLDELVRLKFLDKPPRDAWNKPLSFRCPSEHEKEGADLVSLGGDQKEGTDDDIKSWEL
jgi:general secretion pathway protein G